MSIPSDDPLASVPSAPSPAVAPHLSEGSASAESASVAQASSPTENSSRPPAEEKGSDDAKQNSSQPYVPAPKYGAYAPGWEPGGVHAERAAAERAARLRAQSAGHDLGNIDTSRYGQAAPPLGEPAGYSGAPASQPYSTARFGAPAGPAPMMGQPGGYPPAGAPGSAPMGAPGTMPGNYPPHYQPTGYGSVQYGGMGGYRGGYRPAGYGGQELPKRTGALATLITGLAMVFFIPGICFVFLVGMLIDPISNLVQSEVARPGTNIQLEANHEYFLLPLGEDEDAEDARCTVRDSQGELPVTYRSTDLSSFNLPGPYFTTRQAGSHQINCEIYGRTVSEVAVTDPVNLTDIKGFMPAAIIGTFSFLIGIPVLIVGIVLLTRVNRQRRRIIQGRY